MREVTEAARMLAEARRTARPVPAGVAAAAESLEAGYALQRAVHAVLAATEFGPVVGYKIGCTTPVMQRLLGIDHPCAGGIFAATVWPSGATVDRRRFVRPGVECEIAVRLGAALDARARPVDRAAAARAVASYHAAVEIVDDRYEAGSRPPVGLLVADDFYGAGAVIGPPVTDVDPAALASVTAVLLVDGRPVGQGRGADVLGHPLEALVWLARQAATQDAMLPAGTLVLLGSLVAVHWLEPHEQTVEVANDRLGRVTVRFTADDPTAATP
ncbi:MAG: fumarylacetoacetate hydrolase family protein [Actinomycetia bacterium]|nr:fumarylacetoacetate hydrolase family protein [Actinomycetes bacterium]